MDFWVFIAAAAAGCLTKYLKSSSRTLKGYNGTVDGNGSVDCSPRGMNMVGDGFTSCSLVLEGKAMASASSAGVPSTSGSNGVLARDSEDCSLLSFASAPTEYAGDGTGFGEEDGSAPHDNLSSLGNRGAENFGSTCSFRRLVMTNATLTSRYRHSQPLTSLESCLLAQLYNDHMEQNARAHSLHQTSTSSMAIPLHGTGGNNIISQRSNDLVRGQVSTELHLAENGNVIGVPPLPRIKKPQTRIRRNGSSGISSSTIRRRKFSTQHGMMHGIVIFSLGIYTAVLSCITRKEAELDKLKELLKQSENLVQDLQEELEMKDSLIVQELSDDVYGSQFTRQTSFIAGVPASYESHEGNISKELNNLRMDENVDSMSQIEAELEAELGRLGLNVRCCNIQLNKVDVSGCICKEDGSSSSSMAPSANYSVSPRALALRLHEVIQSRLEERIQELELALENSQRKVRLMESKQKSRSGRLFDGVARPVVMNLSGEGLSTYDEACEEFVTFDSSEDNSPSYGNNYLARSDERNRIEEKPHETLSGAQEIDAFGMSRDESSDADDELLIRQLVERTKRGSPAVMKAQRLLFSDQDDRR